MARPLPDVMYGTPDGVALDQGAAESVRRLRQQGSQQVIAGRAPLRAVDATTGQYGRPSATVTPITPTTPAAPVTPTAPAAPSLRQRVGDTLRQAAPAIGGFGTAVGVNALRQNQLDNAPAMPAPGEAAPGQIPVDTRYAAPPAAAGSLLSQSELGRNVGNALMATPLGSGASASLRAGASMVRAGAPIATAANLATIGSGVARGYAAGDATNPGVSSKAPVLEPTPSIRQPFSDVRNGTYGEGAPDLTGKILRDGNSYSGKDVKFGAEIVNPRNPGVGVSSLDTSEGHRQNLLELQRNAASAQAPGGAVGIGPRGGGNVFDDLRAKNPTVPATRAERMAQAELANRAQIAEAQTSATLRGQDIAAGTSRANTRDTVGASLRGQDMDYAEKMDAKRMDIAARMADRKLRSDIVQASGGDMFKAAQMAAANGIPPADFLATGAGVQSQGEKADAAGRGMFKDLFNTPGKDNKMESRPDLEAQAYASVMQQTGNKFGALPKEQQTALMTESVARVRELESARSRQNGTFGQSWLGRPNEAALDSLPTTEQNAGSKLRHANPWDAFNSNVQMNDVLQTLPDGRVIARDPKLMTQSRLKQLEEQGARWEK